MKRLAVILGSAMLLFPISRISADTITVSYSGTILVSNAPGITTGSPFTGSFTYEDNLPLIGPIGQGTTFFQQDGGGLTFEVDGFNFSIGPGVGSYVGTYVDNPQNQDALGINNQDSQNGYVTNYQALPVFQMSNDFVWNTGALQQGVLPNPFDANGVLFGAPGNLTSASVYLGTFSNSYPVIGQIENVQILSTPEPSTMVSMLAGFSCFGVRLARNRTKSRSI
jgi:hypothetical protein